MQEIIKLQIKQLTLLENNPRKITGEQMQKLEKSLEDDPEFIWKRPVLVNHIDGKYIVYAGNQRVRAAKKLKWKEIPCIVDVNLSNEIIQDRVVKDNKTYGTFDFEMLANEFDIEKLLDAGFTPEELHIDIQDLGSTDEEEGQLLEPPKEPKTKLGDLYELGLHRLKCGDSTNSLHYQELVCGNDMDMVYTDPPYGISVDYSDGKLHGNAKAKRNKFDKILNDDTNQHAKDCFNFCTSLGIPVMIWWGANYYPEVLPISSCWIVWDKDTGTNAFPDAELAWCSDPSPVRIFKHTWNGMIKGSEQGEGRVHPTQKPIALAEWCLNQYGKGCEKILDLFCGSGSTLIACEKLNRICYGMELDPAYCDIIVQRWMKLTGKKAKLNGEEIDSL